MKKNIIAPGIKRLTLHCALAITGICIIGLFYRFGIPFIKRIRFCKQTTSSSLCLYLAPEDNRLPCIKKIEESAVARENAFKKEYLNQRIPVVIAELAAYVERHEDDIKTLTIELSQASPEEQILIQQAINDRDLNVMSALKIAAPILAKYHEKAVRNKNTNLFKIVTILQSCSFLFERSL